MKILVTALCTLFMQASAFAGFVDSSKPYKLKDGYGLRVTTAKVSGHKLVDRDRVILSFTMPNYGSWESSLKTSEHGKIQMNDNSVQSIVLTASDIKKYYLESKRVEPYGKRDWERKRSYIKQPGYSFSARVSRGFFKSTLFFSGVSYKLTNGTTIRNPGNLDPNRGKNYDNIIPYSGIGQIVSAIAKSPKKFVTLKVSYDDGQSAFYNFSVERVQVQK